MIKKILFTKQGLEDKQNELNNLQEERKEAVQNLKTAREMGDLSENAAYKVARSKLSSIDHRVRQIKILLTRAHVVEKNEKDIVDIGSYVTVLNKEGPQEFQIVGGYETDISKNKISCFSPIGRSLIGRKLNDVVKIKIPIGEIEYQITKINNS